MTREDIIHFAKECSSAIYELCMNNPFFNTTECPIGANGLSDVVLNAVLGAFHKTKELASISEPQGLDEAAEEFAKRQGIELAPFARKFFKAGAKWMAEQGETHEHYVIREVAGHDVGPAIVVYPDNFDIGDKVIVQVRKK